jgi:hypothetical protein|tara:strand:+ start:747 stop:1601 length:855 start_codon:yes stop_codon:yes gene_type:complete
MPTEETKSTKKKPLSFRQKRAKCQYEIDKLFVMKSGRNPFFNSDYSTLDDMYKVIKRPLESSGLFHVFKFCNAESGRNILKLQVVDKDSEEFQESCISIPDSVMENPQDFGSYTTYQKRYMLSGFFGLTCPESDNDGESIVRKTPTQKTTSVPSSNGKPVSPKVHEGTPSKSEHWFWGKDDNGNEEAITQKWASDMQKAGEANGITFGQLWDYIFENQFMVYDKNAKKRTPIQSPDSIRYINSDDKQTIMSAIQIGLTPTAQAEEQPELVEVQQEVIEDDDIPF